MRSIQSSPNVRIGILGGGQLGRMLGLAGIPLGCEFHFLDPVASAPARQVGVHTVAAYEDTAALDAFSASVDSVTYEFENVPATSVEYLSKKGIPVFPSAAALHYSQDRLTEKTFFQSLGIPTPAFRALDSRDDLMNAADTLGLPLVLKTRRQGYDGKGQAIIRDVSDLPSAWERLKHTPLIAEQFIPFSREVSLLAVRSVNGETAFYPLAQNTHENGILRLSKAPANVSDILKDKTFSYGTALLDALSYVGVLALELCEYEGELLAIEMAPRVHNSGHWTIEGSETSQFENHLRAMLGLPLGSTDMAVPAACMINLIGTLPDISQILSIPHAHVHLYGKEPRAGRKLGHVTVAGVSASCDDALKAIKQCL